MSDTEEGVFVREIGEGDKRLVIAIWLQLHGIG